MSRTDSRNARWKLVWYGWRNWLKRPAWYTRVDVGGSNPFAAREWGFGPVSLQRRVGW